MRNALPLVMINKTEIEKSTVAFSVLFFGAGKQPQNVSAAVIFLSFERFIRVKL